MTWADYGKPISGSPEILGAAELVRRLYEDLGEGTGGPLHWMLDDGNIYDDQMPDVEEQVGLFAYLWNGDFKKWSQAGADVSIGLRQAIQDTCRGILYAFDRMNEAERTCVLAWRWGDIERELPDWHAAHRTPERLADAREQADEFINLAVAVPLGVQREPERKACISVPCPPFTGQVSGTVHPGSGRRFAPDARITGPHILSADVNPDGSATVTWSPPPEGIDYGSLFAAPGLVSMEPAPAVFDASGFTGEMIAFDPDYRIGLAPPSAPEPD